MPAIRRARAPICASSTSPTSRYRSPAEVQQVLAVAVDERRRGPSLEIVQPAAGERVPLRTVVSSRHRKAHLSFEPRLDYVLIAGFDVEGVVDLQRARVR